MSCLDPLNECFSTGGPVNVIGSQAGGKSKDKSE